MWESLFEISYVGEAFGGGWIEEYLNRKIRSCQMWNWAVCWYFKYQKFNISEFCHYVTIYTQEYPCVKVPTIYEYKVYVYIHNSIIMSLSELSQGHVIMIVVLYIT